MGESLTCDGQYDLSSESASECLLYGAQVTTTGTIIDYFDITCFGGPHSFTMQDGDGNQIDFVVWPESSEYQDGFDITATDLNVLTQPPFGSEVEITGELGAYCDEDELLDINSEWQVTVEYESDITIIISNGCTDVDACNTGADGACEYPDTDYDCDGNCAVDVDCAGVCSGVSVEDCSGECGGSAVVDDCGECEGDGSTCIGCEHELACNYQNEEDAACIFPEENFDCEGNPLSINQSIPTKFGISSAYPNPFNPSINIEYSITSIGHVILQIIGLNGKHVDTINNSIQTQGVYNIQWTPDNVPSGMYLIQLQANNQIQNKKILYLK
jgi:hypothetical protein